MARPLAALGVLTLRLHTVAQIKCASRGWLGHEARSERRLTPFAPFPELELLPNRSVFPRAEGAAAERIRNHDWANTPLGAPEHWPSALRSAVELMLNSPESMYLVWGSGLIFLFNDAYTPILGPRLDRAMGSPLRGLWADAWPAVKEPIKKAFRGEGSRFENSLIAMNHYGQHEDTWWTFSFSPLYGEGDGGRRRLLRDQ